MQGDLLRRRHRRWHSVDVREDSTNYRCSFSYRNQYALEIPRNLKLLHSNGWSAESQVCLPRYHLQKYRLAQCKASKLNQATVTWPVWHRWDDRSRWEGWQGISSRWPTANRGYIPLLLSRDVGRCQCRWCLIRTVHSHEGRGSIRRLQCPRRWKHESILPTMRWEIGPFGCKI